MTFPRGEALLGVLPRLAATLAGSAPPLAPLGTDDPRAPTIAAALGAGRRLAPGEDDPSDPTVLVVATSGSTGAPKGVLLSAGQLAASAAATAERLGGDGTWLLALPAHHIAGLQVLARSVRAGTEPVVLDGSVPFTAAAFAAAARRMTGARRFTSLVPTQLRRVLADAEATAVAAQSFTAVLLGGAACPPPLLASARAAGLQVVTTYGMTETCGGCIYDDVPLRGVSAARTDGGAIALTGPMVARGYRDRPGDPAFATRGTFVTSDTGEIAADGTVRVTGRLDDVIVTGGVNVAPGPVETALTALPGVTEAAVVGVPDPVWGHAVVAAIVADRPWPTEAVRVALTGLPPAHRPQRVVALAQMPLLASGKPDRARLRAALTD